MEHNLPWHISPHHPPTLPLLFDPNITLISLLHTHCDQGNCLTPVVGGHRCATSSFLQCSWFAFAQCCRNRVSGDDGNNVVQNQRSSSANMMTLNSHYTVQCVEAIKLRHVFLKQIGMYHKSVVFSFIGYTWENISDSMDAFCFSSVWSIQLSFSNRGGERPTIRHKLLSNSFMNDWIIFFF